MYQSSLGHGPSSRHVIRSILPDCPTSYVRGILLGDQWSSLGHKEKQQQQTSNQIEAAGFSVRVRPRIPSATEAFTKNLDRKKIEMAAVDHNQIKSVKLLQGNRFQIPEKEKP
ncbi:hypothetical protein RRG08_047218 [Elysia crispata]|uniref:Uncharacterized protein n=1 Tax=Elysia crispata TaxID=231223 RepID=A0AAE1BAC5_9GAST|nr:hypothetical protein RRG08_047218 [Elysia crispata]